LAQQAGGLSMASFARLLKFGLLEGGQSCPQPAFSRLFGERSSPAASVARLRRVSTRPAPKP